MGKLTTEMIIDPDTSQMLAVEMTFGKSPLRDTLYLEVGWTNEKPHTPALP
jgi:hypothetical protein